jgi:hypothetical protein
MTRPEAEKEMEFVPTSSVSGHPASYFGLDPHHDNTAHWERDVVPWMAGGGGRIVFGPGTWTLPALTGPRALHNFTRISGVARGATTLRLADGSNDHFVTNHQSEGEHDPYGRFITLEHLTLDGNKAHQTRGNAVWFSNPSPGDKVDADYDADNHSLLQNVWIKDPFDDGFGNSGGSEVRLLYVNVRNAGRHGIAPNYDSWVSDCTTQWCHGNGFHIGKGSTGLSNNKAFYNWQNGMYVIHAGSTGGAVITNFRAQDNGHNGVYLEGGNNETGRHTTIHGLLCDSNGWGHGGELAEPGTYVALKMWSVQYVSVYGLHSFDRAINHGAGSRVTQENAIDISAGNPGVAHHIYVEGVHCGMTAVQDAQMGEPIKRFSNTADSVVTLNGVTTTT